MLLALCRHLVRRAARCPNQSPQHRVAHRALLACPFDGRLFVRDPEWVICTNLLWLVCAVKGSLPGQNKAAEMDKGGDFILASPKPSAQRIVDGKTPLGFSAQASFTTIHELCLMDRMCENGDELWTAEAETMFKCINPSAVEPGEPD